MSSLVTNIYPLNREAFATEVEYLECLEATLGRAAGPDFSETLDTLGKSEEEKRQIRAVVQACSRLGLDSRSTVDAVVSSSLSTSSVEHQFSSERSIDLEVRLRQLGFLSLGQACRQNSRLLVKDVETKRISGAQLVVANILQGFFSSEYLGLPPITSALAKEICLDAEPKKTHTVFIERFDGRYPVSKEEATQGKLSSLHIARNLIKMGIGAEILGYITNSDILETNGVIITDTRDLEHPDKAIPEDKIVFVTGWTSGFSRLKDRGVAANLVMRSLSEETLTTERLQRIANSGNSCIFVSPQAKERIEVNSAAEVIPNGFNEEIFFYRPSKVKDKVVFAGALVLEKGIDYLVKIAQKIPNLEFVVLGSSTMYGEHRDYIMPQNTDNITFYGEVTQQDIAAHFSEAVATLVLTNPSRTFEVFGKSGLESTICGCPVVYIRNGGLESSIVSHQLTIPIEGPNIDSIVSAINTLRISSKNPQARKDLADKAKKAHKTWGQVSGLFLAKGLETLAGV